jgi:CRISPR/Cas system CSM-associated protein Csm2 small subunit
MNNRRIINIRYVDFFIIGFIFLVLFILPVLFTRINGEIAWKYVFKIWKDQILLIPLFAINHCLLIPKLLLRKKYLTYLTSVIGFIALFSASYYYQDEVLNKKPKRKADIESLRPDPVPPYANLLMYSLLIVGVDSGLSFSKRWHENEENRNRLETENAEMQLNVLRNQLNPHFFMNTLNNIYALVDCNSQAAKEAVMKLSKLMRYMLYETEARKVKISKEFEFIRSYIDLMKLRFTNEMAVHLIIPENYEDHEIPPMLFISYIENAFKYGASYENESFISIIFEINDNKLLFNCSNTNHVASNNSQLGGLGLKNNENRLKLLFGRNFALATKASEKMFYVSLVIPLS